MTLVATVILCLIASTIAMVIVQQALMGAGSASGRAYHDAATRAADGVQAEFELALAADPAFYRTTLFFAERPRMCAATGEPVVATGDPAVAATAWPLSCGTSWEYLPVEQATTDGAGYDPAEQVVRAEILPPSGTHPALRLRILATLGTAEVSRETSYDVPSAAAVTLYSDSDLDLDTLAGDSGTLQATGTIYSHGRVLTPVRAAHTTATPDGPLVGARVLAECAVVGPSAGASALYTAATDADRTAAGCDGPPTADTSDVRTLAPTPLTVDQLRRSVASLRTAACAAGTPTTTSTAASSTAGEGIWSQFLCLTHGATLSDTDGKAVTVAAPGGGAPAAYRLTFTGTPANATVQVMVATTAPTSTPTCAVGCDQVALSRAAYAAGTHPLSAPGGTWSDLGTFPLPLTGVLTTDAPVVVGSCTTSLQDAGACAPAGPARPVTVIAGTPVAPMDITIAGPLTPSPGAALGLIATGKITLAFYARPATGDLTINASLLALGTGDPGSITSESVTGNDGGTLHVNGSLGGSNLGPLNGWSALTVAPAAQAPARFASFTPFWRMASSVPLSPAALCGQVTCATTW